MPKKRRKGTTPKKAAKKKMSKADFVRSLPAETGAKDAVAKAKAAGVSLTESYFYNVRATDKSAKRKTARRPAKGLPATPRNGVAPSTPTSSEKVFRKLVLDLGIARSK